MNQIKNYLQNNKVFFAMVIGDVLGIILTPIAFLIVLILSFVVKYWHEKRANTDKAIPFTPTFPTTTDTPYPFLDGQVIGGSDG